MYFIDTYTIRSQTNQFVGLNMFRAPRVSVLQLRETLALGVYFETYHRCVDLNGLLRSRWVEWVDELDCNIPIDTMGVGRSRYDAALWMRYAWGFFGRDTV